MFNRGLDKKDTESRTVIHTLRHTFASLLVIQGTPIYTVQKLLNHADPSVTMRYAKLAPDQGSTDVGRMWSKIAEASEQEFSCAAIPSIF
jgi:site-specific recombinase XerD